MKRKTSLLLLAVYVIIGCILASKDPFVLPIYLTVLPFHGFLLYKSFETKNIMFIMICLMTFLSHGIGTTVYYLDRANASSVGFGAIGDFDFSYHQFWDAYSYFALFLIALWLMVLAFKKRWHTNFLPGFVKDQYSFIVCHSSSWSILPLLLTISAFIMISIWMYENHIGMIGLQQTRLPFHLTGIIFYARRFLFPIVLIWLYIKTKSKNISSFLLIVYSLVVGILATSKSAALLVLLPLIYLNFMMGKKKMAYVCIIAAVAVYAIIGELRVVIYETDAEIDLRALFSTSIEFSTESDSFFIFLLKNITNRIYGLQSTVLGNQYYKLSFNDLLAYYSHAKIVDLIPDYVHTLFGITLPPDKAYGVGLGYNGTMQLLSCHNYLYTIFQALIISIFFVIQNNCLQKVFLNSHIIYKYVSLFIMLLSFYQFYDGVEFASVIILTVAMTILCHFACGRKKIGAIHVYS